GALAGAIRADDDCEIAHGHLLGAGFLRADGSLAAALIRASADGARRPPTRYGTPNTVCSTSHGIRGFSPVSWEVVELECAGCCAPSATIRRSFHPDAQTHSSL